MFLSLYNTLFSFRTSKPKYSHKKRKDCREKRADVVVLRAYDVNQAILESILLYSASKHKQIKEQGS